MNKLSTFILVFLLGSRAANAQNDLTAYNDYMGHFKVFAAGNIIDLEYTPITNFKVGGNAIAYTDQRSNFKIYYNGEAKIVEEDAPTEVVTTTNYLVYKMTRKLSVFDKGALTTLTNATLDYYASDSIVAWINYPDGNFNVYENGASTTLETPAVNKTITAAKVGSNIIAYADLANVLKVYYKGQTYTTNITLNYVKQYECAANTVAFTEEYSNTFNVFYKGRFITLETNLPQSFTIANDMVSYIDNIGNFKLFYAGTTTTLESFKPESSIAINNMLVYTYANKFMVFYKGKNYTLENFIPKDPLYGINSILYTDAGGKLKFFDKGTTYANFFFETPNTLSLIGDVPLIKYAINSVAFFYNGKLY